MFLGPAELGGQAAHEGTAHLRDLKEKFFKIGPVDKTDAAVFQRLAGAQVGFAGQESALPQQVGGLYYAGNAGMKAQVRPDYLNPAGAEEIHSERAVAFVKDNIAFFIVVADAFFAEALPHGVRHTGKDRHF